MPLRFLEARLPRDVLDEVHDLASSHELIDNWHVPAPGQEIHRFLLESNRVEGLVDSLRSRFGDEIRIMVLPVEATLPRQTEATVETAADQPMQTRDPSRVSREELYEDIHHRIQLSPVFVSLAAASAIVASIGLLWDDVVAVIAAMVIAPLLGPNVALALATTLGDATLARSALRSGLAGIAISFVIAIGMGWILPVDITGGQIASRIDPDWHHVALALVSGVAGGLAFTSGLPASLIGVMVAVALLPPLATGGLLIGAGMARESAGAFLLLGVNLIAVNLAGVATFLAQGIRPVFASEKRRARKAAVRALVAWTLLLVAFVAGVLAIRGGVA